MKKKKKKKKNVAAYVKQLPCDFTPSGLLRINFHDILSAKVVQAIYLYFSLNPCNPAKSNKSPTYRLQA
jgi:hypothetical protein